MRVIGVIPARWGSTRLPGKSLVPICGKPLIQWVVEAVRGAHKLDELIVATDDGRIVEAVEAIGGTAVMTRSDHPSGTDRIAEAIQGRAVDVVVNIQGDEPMIDPALVDRLVDVMGSGAGWDMATAVAPVKDDSELRNPSVVKAVFDDSGRALYFSRSVIPYVRDNDMEANASVHWRHIGIYAYTVDFLMKYVSSTPCLMEIAEKLEQLRALYMGARIAVLREQSVGMGVDTPADVKYIEELLKKKKKA